MSLQTCYIQKPNNSFFQQTCQLKCIQFYALTPRIEPALHNVSSIPLIHTKIANNPSLNRKLAIRRDKYFTTVSAVGPDTIQILNKLRKMKKVHVIKRFEFDPYLCDESGIKPLNKFIIRLRRVKELAFTLRRIDYTCSPDKKEMLEPIGKISGLRKIRIELPSTLDLNDNTFMKMMKAIHSKYPTLKTYHLVMNSLQGVSEYSLRNSMMWLDRMKCLEDLSMNIIKKQSFQNEIYCHERIGLKHQKKIKNFNMVFGVASNGWNASTSNNCPILLLSSLAHSINPKKMSIKFLSALFITPVVDALKLSMIKHDRLKDFSIDIVSSELEDSVVVYAVKTFTENLNLERLTFKITQRPSDSNLSGETLLTIVQLISKAAHLKKFDVYLRNILLESREKRALNERLVSLTDNIKYKHLDRSLHLFRN